MPIQRGPDFRYGARLKTGRLIRVKRGNSGVT